MTTLKKGQIGIWIDAECEYNKFHGFKPFLSTAYIVSIESERSMVYVEWLTPHRKHMSANGGWYMNRFKWTNEFYKGSLK